MSLVLAACTDGEERASGVPELELIPGNLVSDEEPLALLHDGDPVSVVLATQGGQVIYVGARVRGMPPGAAQVSARLVEPDSGDVLVEEHRGTVLVPVAGVDGWLEPRVTGRTGISHLLACPMYGDRPLIGLPWRLELELWQSGAPRAHGAASVIVVPECVQGASSLVELCHCECSAGFFAGKCAAPG